MKIQLLITTTCLLFASWNIQAGDKVPDILSSLEMPATTLTQKTKTMLRGENIRSPARVHAQTYCRNYNSPESRCVYVSSRRRYAGNGKYWYRTLFQDSRGGYYWSKY